VVVLAFAGLVTILVAVVLGSRLQNIGEESRVDQRALNGLFELRDGLRLEEASYFERLAAGVTTVPASSRTRIEVAKFGVGRIAARDSENSRSARRANELRAALQGIERLIPPEGREPPLGTPEQRALHEAIVAAITRAERAFTAWITLEDSEIAAHEADESSLRMTLVGWLIGSVALMSAAALATWLFLERARRRLTASIDRRRASQMALLTALQDGLVAAGPDGTIRQINDPFCRMTGFTRGELEGSLPPYPYWAAEDVPRIESAVARALDGEGGEYDLTFARRDGSRFPVIANISPLRDDDGSSAGYLGTFKDITERKTTAAAEAREAATAEGLRRAIEARDAERAHLARELHDDTAHGLAIMALQLDVLQDHITDEEGRQALEELQESTHTTLAGVRALATELRPPTLREYGLGGAIERQAVRLREIAGTEIDIDLSALPEDLNEEVQVALFRVVHEALANVARHSGARRARVDVERDDGLLRVMISDDGRGFDPDTPTDRLGLAGMRERLDLIAGRLIATSDPGEGTTLVAEIPLRHGATASARESSSADGARGVT
jgi:PAS domain S-box-containing protein